MLWTKVASALEGLTHSFLEHFDGIFLTSEGEMVFVTRKTLIFCESMLNFYVLFQNITYPEEPYSGISRHGWVNLYVLIQVVHRYSTDI